MVNFSNLFDFIGELETFIPLIRTIITAVIIFFVFSFILGQLKKALLKRARKKKQISNVEIFSRILKYLFMLILILFIVFTYAGSWAGLGLSVGLLTAALGWALQKPITGIAGWIMVVTKRPFEIGDRVIIGDVKGDVKDITLTHIYLQETGGRVSSEEKSGRTILVPNSIIFEKNIINYTLDNEFILDEVVVVVTYESNIDKAEKLSLEAVKKITKSFAKKTGKKPYVRTYFTPRGMKLNVRYFAPTQSLQEISSKITREIYNSIRKARGVSIAYPRTNVALGKQKW